MNTTSWLSLGVIFFSVINFCLGFHLLMKSTRLWRICGEDVLEIISPEKYRAANWCIGTSLFTGAAYLLLFIITFFDPIARYFKLKTANTRGWWRWESSPIPCFINTNDCVQWGSIKFNRMAAGYEIRAFTIDLDGIPSATIELQVSEQEDYFPYNYTKEVQCEKTCTIHFQWPEKIFNDKNKATEFTFRLIFETNDDEVAKTIHERYRITPIFE